MIQKIEFSSDLATLYRDSEVPARAVLLYFHGGGLLFGTRRDLPDFQKAAFLSAGYPILAFDYPLAPAAHLPEILASAAESIRKYPRILMDCGLPSLPYVLWGRSAGAYLCLLLASGKWLSSPQPAGLISYYGYGFLCDNWLGEPCAYYTALPQISREEVAPLFSQYRTEGSLEQFYSLYVYARQTGSWRSLFYDGREKYFWLDDSLRTVSQLPCPLFATHSILDPDVPWSEYQALCEHYHPAGFPVTEPEHDFDRRDTAVTRKLLSETLRFLDSLLI